MEQTSYGTMALLRERFLQIASWPRPSGKEREFVMGYLVPFAEQLNLDYQVYGGDIFVMNVPATQGYEDKPVTLVQCHSDMVTNSDDMLIPQGVHQEGNWLRTNGKTTLGADNGMFIAIFLQYVSDPGTTHGPLRFLVTPEEETGCKGIKRVPATVFEDVTYYINGDWETEGDICTGSGGIIMMKGVMDTVCSNAVGKVMEITIKGLSSGHSGVEINKEGANSNQIILRTLYELYKKCDHPFRIISLNGGKGMSVIAPATTARILFEASVNTKGLLKTFDEIVDSIQSEFERTDPGMAWERSFKDCREPVNAAPVEWTSFFLSSSLTLPHGVWYYDKSGVPQTSVNMASVTTANNEGSMKLTFQFMLRGCIQSQLNALKDRIDASFSRIGTTKVLDTVLGWRPQRSHLEEIAAKAFKLVFIGWTLTAGPTHAGLECAIALKSNPDMQMISFGPNIDKVHTPEEGVDLGSCVRTYNWLYFILQIIATEDGSSRWNLKIDHHVGMAPSVVPTFF